MLGLHWQREIEASSQILMTAWTKSRERPTCQLSGPLGNSETIALACLASQKATASSAIGTGHATNLNYGSVKRIARANEAAAQEISWFLRLAGTAIVASPGPGSSWDCDLEVIHPVVKVSSLRAFSSSI